MTKLMNNIEYYIDTVGPSGRFTQRIEGWIHNKDGKAFGFRAVSDNNDKIEVEVHSKYRPDVFKNLHDGSILLNTGFVCEINGFDAFYKKGYKYIELQVGSHEYVSIYTFDVKKIYENDVLFHCC